MKNGKNIQFICPRCGKDPDEYLLPPNADMWRRLWRVIPNECPKCGEHLKFTVKKDE